MSNLGTGTSSANIKVNTAIGNTIWANAFFITGIIDTDSITWKLFSPLPLIQQLPHAQLTTLSKVIVSSTSTDDNATGIGARVVIVTGLGEFYQIQEEVVLMDGQNGVESSLLYQYNSEATILQVGSYVNPTSDTGDLAPVGDIYVGTGIPINGVSPNPILGIKASEDNLNSREGIFQVPDGFFILIKGYFVTNNVDKAFNTSIEVQLAVNLFGTPNNQFFKGLPNIYDSTVPYEPESLLLLPPKTKIQIRGKMQEQRSTRATIELAVELIAMNRINFG